MERWTITHNVTHTDTNAGVRKTWRGREADPKVTVQNTCVRSAYGCLFHMVVSFVAYRATRRQTCDRP